MKTAIISDTHLGNPQSRLAKKYKFDPSGLYTKLRGEILELNGRTVSPMEF